jgi:monoterpene epsilon-lactone hydrolase
VRRDSSTQAAVSRTDNFYLHGGGFFLHLPLSHKHFAHRLTIMGDSAGGNLALVTLLRTRDEGLALPACATLLSPGADLTYSDASYQSNARAARLVPMNALHQVTTQ